MQPSDLTNDELRAAMSELSYTQDLIEAQYLAALYAELVRRFHAGEWDV